MSAAEHGGEEEEEEEEEGNGGSPPAAFGYSSLGDGGDEAEDEEAETADSDDGRARARMARARAMQMGLAERMLAREEAAYDACLAMEGRLGGEAPAQIAEEEEEEEEELGCRGKDGGPGAERAGPRPAAQDAEEEVAAGGEGVRTAGVPAPADVPAARMSGEDVSFIKKAMQGLQLGYQPEWASGLKDAALLDMVSRAKGR